MANSPNNYRSAYKGGLGAPHTARRATFGPAGMTEDVSYV
jgi:hypothetical protein